MHRVLGPSVYLLGVLVGSTVSVFVLNSTAGVLARRLDLSTRMVWLLVVLNALLVVEVAQIWLAIDRSVGLNRQTPYRWRFRGLPGILGWGMDTGIPVTTVRATPMPLMAVLLVAFGFGAPYAGLFYAAGIAAGLWVELTRQRSLANPSVAGHIPRRRPRVVLLAARVVPAVVACGVIVMHT